MTPLEPGWYRDPGDPRAHRHWDGITWDTDGTVEEPPPGDGEPGPAADEKPR